MMRLVPGFVIVLLCIPAAERAALAQDASQIPGAFASADHENTDVLGAVADSLRLLALEHGARLALQPKTRAELGGPFWLDYHRSVRMPQQWGDTDGWFTNYVGHPIHGAAAGMIWLAHTPRAPLGLGPGDGYWKSRGQAAIFSAVYSLQFEIGPLSEASIGNVGLNPQTVGWVDHVVTPTGGFAMMVVEDAVDKYGVGWFERRVQNRVARAVVRMALNPSRTMANVAQSRAPWARLERPLGWR